MIGVKCFFEIPNDLFSMYNVVRMQHDCLRNVRTLDTVCIGSSHAFKDYFAEEGEFNLGASNADLYIADKLHNFVTEGFPKIRNVILFYDVFSPGFELEKTSSWYKQLPYAMLYNMPWRYLSLEKRLKSLKMSRVLSKMPAPVISDGYRGNSSYDWFFPSDTSVVERVRGHLKNAFRNGGSLRYVTSIIRRAKIHGQKLVIIFPPLRSDYFKLLPPSECLYHDLFLMLENCQGGGDVVLMNAMNDNDMKDSDFGDMDHLNECGAKKFSSKLRCILR